MLEALLLQLLTKNSDPFGLFCILRSLRSLCLRLWWRVVYKGFSCTFSSCASGQHLILRSLRSFQTFPSESSFLLAALAPIQAWDSMIRFSDRVVSLAFYIYRGAWAPASSLFHWQLLWIEPTSRFSVTCSEISDPFGLSAARSRKFANRFQNAQLVVQEICSDNA